MMFSKDNALGTGRDRNSLYRLSEFIRAGVTGREGRDLEAERSPSIVQLR